MIKILFPFICGIIGAWRGWTLPRFIHGYWRGLITAYVIIGTYCLCTHDLTLFSIKGLMAIICITVLEGILGYGDTCEQIDYLVKSKDIKGWIISDNIKELFSYLGFISMSYYLFPYMILNPFKSTWVYILIAIAGYRVFPITKMIQIKVYNKICETHKLTIPIIKKKINLPNWINDSWKIVEFTIWFGYGLWFIVE